MACYKEALSDGLIGNLVGCAEICLRWERGEHLTGYVSAELTSPNLGHLSARPQLDKIYELWGISLPAGDRPTH